MQLITRVFYFLNGGLEMASELHTVSIHTVQCVWLMTWSSSQMKYQRKSGGILLCGQSFSLVWELIFIWTLMWRSFQIIYEGHWSVADNVLVLSAFDSFDVLCMLHSTSPSNYWLTIITMRVLLCLTTDDLFNDEYDAVNSVALCPIKQLEQTNVLLQCESRSFKHVWFSIIG